MKIGCILFITTLLPFAYCLASKQDIVGVYQTFDLKKKKDWLGMNRMHLTYPNPNSETVKFFQILIPVFICFSLVIVNLFISCLVVDTNVWSHPPCEGPEIKG